MDIKTATYEEIDRYMCEKYQDRQLADGLKEEVIRAYNEGYQARIDEEKQVTSSP